MSIDCPEWGDKAVYCLPYDKKKIALRYSSLCSMEFSRIRYPSLLSVSSMKADYGYLAINNKKVA